MVEAITPGWRFVSIGLADDAVSLRGHDAWKHEWRRVGSERITVAHPSYPAQRHTMFVHELVVAGEKIRFAAGEFSNGVWGFYVPESLAGERSAT